ncbi:S-layer homology domain-containing protein [Alkalihalophilus lindianensis]|uniref:S-layer homology domain-containing protein n=1 Tax=Alkalihalophilus lindianensis TaxID=1630542 RepID=A0ABU3X8X7_9BACI|nr:S-layer homology domain-containing protein [Alkalihalophilus lindianensis]MDV2684330.1 S-layer homology domain-containing protein [Alkalihalophilus lindianensis]
MRVLKASVVFMFLIFFGFATVVSASDNGSYAERKALLTDLALKHDVPPEIVKAIAYRETGMRQFDDNGNAVRNLNNDGGIGIMQVTMSAEEMTSKGIDAKRLESDMAYNIEIGIQILKEKLRYQGIRTPFINNGNDLTKLESWYFAILAYNGLEVRNDPLMSTNTYQGRIYQSIRTEGLLHTYPPKSFPVTYRDNSNILYFENDQLNVEVPDRVMTPSTQMFEIGEEVYSFNPSRGRINVRVQPDTTSQATPVHHITPMRIINGPYHDNVRANHFVFYKVERLDTGDTGYVASSYLRAGNPSVFSDIPETNYEMREAVALLRMRGSVNGYSDGSFGINKPLQRRHAAVIFVNELGLTLPENYQPRSTDHENHSAIIIAEAHGLLTPYEDGTIRPRDSFRRSQMATVLNRIYGDRFEEPTRNVVFTDIGPTFNGYENINRIAYNNVTAVEGEAFRPNEAVRRGQFAVFLNRVDDLLKK